MRLSQQQRFDAQEFYAAAWPRLVGALTLFTGSAAEAEDVAQEAFVRLLRQWPKVSRYDSPEGWLRRVAFNLAMTRGRTTARRHHRLEAISEAQPVTDPSREVGDRLTMAAALAQLPKGQRQAVVLFHLCDLPTAEAAAVLGVSDGTLRTRLTRARQALARSDYLEVE